MTQMLEKDIPSSQLSQEEVPEEPPPGEKKPEEKEAGDAVQEPKSMKEEMYAAEARTTERKNTCARHAPQHHYGIADHVLGPPN